MIIRENVYDGHLVMQCWQNRQRDDHWSTAIVRGSYSSSIGVIIILARTVSVYSDIHLDDHSLFVHD